VPLCLNANERAHFEALYARHRLAIRFRVRHRLALVHEQLLTRRSNCPVKRHNYLKLKKFLRKIRCFTDTNHATLMHRTISEPDEQ
jgi:hypothetical protein